jgi:hypothetical protein
MANTLAAVRIDERNIEPVSARTLEELQVELLPARTTLALIALASVVKELFNGLTQLIQQLSGKHIL